MSDTEMIRLSSADFDEAMDFMNMVFSMSGASTDFAALLPKLYRPEDRLMRDNLAIRRNGRLRAVVGSYPMRLQVGQAVLPVRGIGGVSTHPAERKSGLMRRLMLAALDEMNDEHCALSILGGQRQRYGYYGYEQSGRIMTISINQSNLRHFFRNRQPVLIRFTRIKPEGHDLKEAARATEAAGEAGTERSNGDSKQPAESIVNLMKAWHDRQPVHMQRSETDFLTILSSWYHEIWLASDEQDKPLGYLVANGDGTAVSELIAADPERVLDIAAAWAQRQTAHSVHFRLAPWQNDAIRALMTLGESVSIDSAYCFRIHDWPLVLSSFLQVQGGLKPLAEGTLRLGVIDADARSVAEPTARKDAGSNAEPTAGTGTPPAWHAYMLEWKGGHAVCRVMDTDPVSQPDLLLDRWTATRLVFGPLAPECIVPDADLSNPEIARLLASWFPLPACVLEPDHI